MNLESRNAILAGDHHVEDAEPVSERLIRILEDGASYVGKAVGRIGGARIALPAVFHRGNGADIDAAAAGAADNRGPAMAHQIVGAGILVGEGGFPFLDGHLVDALGGHDPNSLANGAILPRHYRE